MATSQRLTFEERKKIHSYLPSKISLSKIGKLLGRGKNVVVAEVRRSGGRENYDPIKAQELAKERRNRQVTSNHRKSLQTLLDAHQKDVIRLHEQGLSFLEISKELNIAELSLQRLCKALNLPTLKYFEVLRKLEQRIYDVEQQINILFEMRN